MSKYNKSIPYIPQSPYGKSLNIPLKIDKTSIIWRDFLNGVKRRKRLLNHIRNIGLDENDMTITLKRLLLEMRQLTLKVIEDALEIEYRSQFGEVKAPIRAGVAMQLPPITSFRGLEGKEDLYMLSDIITDTDDLYSLPNIKAFLPLDFPLKRNPFLLGQDIDGLAMLEGPRPEPGNVAMELKALEFLRYKRASKALLRAEVQVMNKMPLMLEDIEHIWKFMSTDPNINLLIRVVITLLHPDNIHGTERSPELRYLIDDAIYMDCSEFLRQLNHYKQNESSYTVELLAAVRHVLKECSTINFTDIATSFLMEWVRVIVGSDCFKLNDYELLEERKNQNQQLNTNDSKHGHNNNQDNNNNNNNSNSNNSIDGNNNNNNNDNSNSNNSIGKNNDQQNQKQNGNNKNLQGQQNINDSLTPGKKLKSDINQKDGFKNESPKKSTNKLGNRKLRRPKHEDNQVGGVSQEVVNTLKYEVIKMQQELLKRKILDPKVYGVVPGKAFGLDNAITGKSNKNQEIKQEIITLEEPNELTPFTGIMDTFNAFVLLKELMLLKFSSTGSIELLVNSTKTILYTQYRREITPEEPINNDKTISGTQIITFNSLNKLLFDRLTGYQIDSLFDMSEKVRRNNLAPFITLTQSHLDRLANPNLLKQQINFYIDLCLLREVLITGNISVDIEIERYEESPGLIIRAIPRQGSLLSSSKMDSNPITLFVHDKELLVLLINQRGLYTLALTKWSCLEMVARWLLSRIQINRIPIPVYTSKSLNFDQTGNILNNNNIDNDNNINNSNIDNSIDNNDNINSIDNNNKFNKTKNNSNETIKTYFEVYLDRSVDIDQEVKNYWFAHNLPVLNGINIKYDIMAKQEMEMLYITINLTLTFLHPSVIARRKKEKEEAKIKNSTLYQFTSQYDDEYYSDQVIPNTWDIPYDQDPEVESHILQFVFGLTGIELLMFGTGETLDEKNSKSKSNNNYQSNQFMKSIMSRLHLNYLGNKSQPHDEEYVCTKEENWEIKYSRRLLRNIRTVSGGTMIITASGVGNEILFEAKPTDNVLFGDDIGSKLFSSTELEDIVKSEAWTIDLLDPGNRVTLAHKIMEKLKVILDHDKHRLEFYTYPETRMLEIVVQATINKPETSIGLVEINSLLTLSDLRIVINHELDRDLIPKLYRFIYKSSGCALKQEPFRKAWECLPKCYLAAKTVKEVTRSQDTSEKSQEAIDKALQKAKKMEEDAQKKNKLAKKLIPIPIPTLCMAQEGVWEIYTRHDMTSILQPGDILRIGHIESSDFIIPMSFNRIIENSKIGAEQSDGTILESPKPIKAIPIDQYFLTFGESGLFIYGNTPFSSLPIIKVEKEPEIYLDENGKAIIVEEKIIDPESLISSIYHYPVELKEKDKSSLLQSSSSKEESIPNNPNIEKDLQITSTIDSKQKLLHNTTTTINNNNTTTTTTTITPLMKQNSPGSLEPIKPINPILSSTLKAVNSDLVNSIINPSIDSNDKINKQSNNSREPGKIYRDMWIWKCIPRSEDKRPKWRQMYDNGEIKYNYIYQDTNNIDPILFHVKVPLKLIEEFCRDFRCEDMTIYSQRVNEVSRIPLDLYTDLTYTHIVNLVPVTVTQGIDELKFISLLKTLNVFPDIHKPARISQLTLAFFREVNGLQGDETYLNYYGFCALLQEISLIRFPSGIFDLDECEKNGEFKLGDGPPLPPLPLPISATSASASGSPLSSPIQVAEPELNIEEMLSTSSSPTPRALLNEAALKWQSQNFRKSSIAMITTKKPKIKKKVVQSKKNKLEGLDSPLVTQVDPRHASLAYRKFIIDYLITIPEVSNAIWTQAKDYAMEKEILKYAAITRIIACWRKVRDKSRYRFFRQAMIVLQSYARMKQSHKKVKTLIKYFEEDWLFRLRYHCAILIQSSIRRYNARCWYIKTIDKIREREIIVTKSRRQRTSKLRQKERKTIVFKQIRRINGVMVLLILRRKDQRNYSNDYGMRLEVYNPQFQLINVFIIEEVDLRRFMQDVLRADALSVGDLLNKNNLEKVISVRLLCRLSKRVGDPPKFILSRQALGQKGPKIMTRGRNINGELFVCTLYETGYDIVVQCYHQHTSIMFPCTLLTSAIIEWVTKVYHTTCKSEIEKQLQPPLLRNENKKLLHKWLIDNIVVDKRHGKFNVMFAIQYKKSVKMESIIKIQSIIRRTKARSLIPYLLDKYMLKIKTSVYDDSYYYLNINTGESSWEKPSLLKSHQDLPTQPYYHWVQLYYTSDPLYVNPLTGKYTHLTPYQAAKKIQSMIRNWMLKPFKLTKDEFMKGRTYEVEAKSSYEREPKRLAFVLNYALVAFCINLDYRLTKTLILEALTLADANPTTTRLYAIYLLATCEAPIGVTREQAETLLRDAWRRDNEGLKFKTALTMFFKYGCYRQPRNCRTLLNLGLVEFHVYKNLRNAEICLRRALAMSPFDEYVMENWKKLRDNFPETKRVYRPRGRLDKMNAEALGGGKKTTIHGRPVIENLSWAGWVFVESDPLFKDDEGEYWYNPATGQQQKHMPEDWLKEWELRAWRSVYEGEKDGLEHYYDPITATYFQRHILTNTYQ